MKRFEQQDTDFLYQKEFIEWRLFRTEEQDLYWKRFADEHPESREALNKAIRKFNAVKLNDFELAEADKELLLRRILANVRRRSERARNRRRVLYWTVAAAAAIALLIVTTLTIIQQDADMQGVDVDAIAGQELPSNEIRLISGETVVELGQNAHITVTQDGRIAVAQETDLYEMSLSDNTINRLIVPNGKRSMLSLSDGTKLWLNSGTELEFPSRFTGDKREITVNGEVYAEVASGQAPFYVNTAQFKVLVHGTKFNVSAYGNDPENSVTLVQGSVEVVSANDSHRREDAILFNMRLAPNEKATISDNIITKETVNVDEYISWKDGVLIFNQTPILEVIRKLERYYNVKFEVDAESELSAKTCTGKLFLSENFDNVMNSLSILSSTQFRITE